MAEVSGVSRDRVQADAEEAVEDANAKIEGSEQIPVYPDPVGILADKDKPDPVITWLLEPERWMTSSPGTPVTGSGMGGSLGKVF